MDRKKLIKNFTLTYTAVYYIWWTEGDKEKSLPVSINPGLLAKMLIKEGIELQSIADTYYDNNEISFKNVTIAITECFDDNGEFYGYLTSDDECLEWEDFYVFDLELENE